MTIYHSAVLRYLFTPESLLNQPINFEVKKVGNSGADYYSIIYANHTAIVFLNKINLI